MTTKNNAPGPYGLRSFPLMRIEFKDLMRIKFIEAMFIEYGFITRKIITDALGIESAMASRDMAFYSTINATIHLNRATRRWEATRDFIPVGLLSGDANNYLAACGVVFGFELGEILRTKTEFGVIK